MNREGKSKSIYKRVTSRIDEKTQHLSMFRTGDLHSTQIGLDHRERIGRNPVLLIPNDRVVADHVAVPHTQELRPQKTANFLWNRVFQQSKHRGIHTGTRIGEAFGLLGKALTLVEEQIVPERATTGRIVDLVLLLKTHEKYIRQAYIGSVRAIARFAGRDDAGIDLDETKHTPPTFRKDRIDSVTTKTELRFKIVVVIHFTRKENNILHFITSIFLSRYNPSFDTFWILQERMCANIIHFFGRHGPAVVVFFP